MNRTTDQQHDLRTLTAHQQEWGIRTITTALGETWIEFTAPLVADNGDDSRLETFDAEVVAPYWDLTNSNRTLVLGYLA